jgi:methionyl-tRNA formyltransferase
MLKKVAILTSPTSWFVPYAEDLRDYLKWLSYEVSLFFRHEEITCKFDVLFILSYFRKVPKCILLKNRYNLVVHESNLPQGKGWAPLFWQILEGKNKIPVVLFEATEEIDGGKIFLKDFIELSGYELHDEIRRKQAKKTLEMCIKFLKQYRYLKPVVQIGEETFYPKRTPLDSQLDVDKTIREQFNLLRIVDNENYPAFFIIDGHKYILKIYEGEKENDKGSENR